MKTTTTTNTGAKTMTTKQRIKNLKIDAEVLRYCGFNARADYQLMQINVRTTMTASQWHTLQENTKSCVMVVDGFLK